MSELNSNHPQLIFFQQILNRFPRKAAAITTLAELLEIGEDAIYRRIRAETPISLEEALMLAQQFGLSLDALLQEDSPSVQWTYSAFRRPIHAFEDFISDTLQQVQALQKVGAAQVFYTSKDLPIFYAMQFPEILAFKLYTWGVTTWQFESLQDKAFQFDMISSSIIAQSKQIAEAYNYFDSHELWSENILNGILRQIEYLATIDLFAHEADAFLLCDRLSEFVVYIQKMAETGNKTLVGKSTKGGRFALYNNEMVRTNNIILVKSPDINFVTTAFCNPQTLQTRDARTVQFVEEWMQTLIQHANSISVHSPVERNQFFSRLQKDVQTTRQRLKVIFR